jgi:ATP-binding cassette subfamily B (MDR/TAP) protein 1
VAFIKGWLLTIVMLSTIPPLAVAAAIISNMLSKVSSEGLASYADAGNIVEQTIGSIKTVGPLLIQSRTTNLQLINIFIL